MAHNRLAHDGRVIWSCGGQYDTGKPIDTVPATFAACCGAGWASQRNQGGNAWAVSRGIKVIDVDPKPGEQTEPSNIVRSSPLCDAILWETNGGSRVQWRDGEMPQTLLGENYPMDVDAIDIGGGVLAPHIVTADAEKKRIRVWVEGLGVPLLLREFQSTGLTTDDWDNPGVSSSGGYLVIDNIPYSIETGLTVPGHVHNPNAYRVLPVVIDGDLWLLEVEELEANKRSRITIRRHDSRLGYVLAPRPIEYVQHALADGTADHALEGDGNVFAPQARILDDGTLALTWWHGVNYALSGWEPPTKWHFGRYAGGWQFLGPTGPLDLTLEDVCTDLPAPRLLAPPAPIPAPQAGWYFAVYGTQGEPFDALTVDTLPQQFAWERDLAYLTARQRPGILAMLPPVDATETWESRVTRTLALGRVLKAAGCLFAVAARNEADHDLQRQVDALEPLSDESDLPFYIYNDGPDDEWPTRLPARAVLSVNLFYGFREQSDTFLRRLDDRAAYLRWRFPGRPLDATLAAFDRNLRGWRPNELYNLMVAQLRWLADHPEFVTVSFFCWGRQSTPLGIGGTLMHPEIAEAFGAWTPTEFRKIVFTVPSTTHEDDMNLQASAAIASEVANLFVDAFGVSNTAAQVQRGFFALQQASSGMTREEVLADLLAPKFTVREKPGDTSPAAEESRKQLRRDLVTACAGKTTADIAAALKANTLL
jgi:hypothetical protein